MAVPLLDLKRHYLPLATELEAVVLDVLRGGTYIGGPYVEKLEKQIADLCRCKRAVAVSSGTDAILVALMALDIKPGDEIITTPYTFFATAGCIARLGAVPVFVDIDPLTFNIDKHLIARAVTPRTKAILPVHLYGQIADMDAINSIAAEHDLAVVEDACQAIGASRDGKMAGAIGAVGCFSFYPTKNLSGIGDGGIVTTNDELLGEKIAILRNHGMNPRYHHHLLGGNFRLDAIQCAPLTVKIPHLPEWNNKRRANATRYRQLFDKAGLTDSNFRGRGQFIGPGVTLPTEVTPGHIYHQYIIRVSSDHRDRLIAHLKARNIGCEIYYPVPLHLQECFKYLGHHDGDYPESERASIESIALPIFPELTDSELEEVVTAIADYFG
ncbi:MAG: DegT/DnrJ/EryC1/StrS family aminotransferase [Phycisphaeraceae bacterium]